MQTSRNSRPKERNRVVIYWKKGAKAHLTNCSLSCSQFATSCENRETL